MDWCWLLVHPIHGHVHNKIVPSYCSITAEQICPLSFTASLFREGLTAHWSTWMQSHMSHEILMLPVSFSRHNYWWSLNMSDQFYQVSTHSCWSFLRLSHMLADAAGPLTEFIKLLRTHEVVFQRVSVGMQGGGEPLQAAILCQHLQPVPADPKGYLTSSAKHV